jgi:Tfp pilus assembly protein PilO
VPYKYLQFFKCYLSDKNIFFQKNFLSKPAAGWQFLDKLSLSRIVIMGTSIILLAVIAVQVLAVRPLTQQLDAASTKERLLRQKYQDILAEEAKNNLLIPDRADFPQMLEQINHCFKSENVSVKAIDITQSSMKRGDFFQATIKVNGEGELKKILQAVNTIQRQQEVPFLIEELDYVDGEAEIHLSVLIRSE